jgi:photosystem II stability/assembly factor-like uncharacterized protein
MNRLTTILLSALIAFAPAARSFAQWHQTSGPAGGNTTALYAKGNTIFAANYNQSQLGNNQGDIGTLYRSTDHGQHWTPSGTGLSGVVKSITSSDTVLFVATTAGIFRSTDDGLTWSVVSNTAQIEPEKLHFSGGMLYAGSSSSGMYRSSNNGATFTPSSQGLPSYAAITAIARLGDALFAGVGSLYPNPIGVFRSMDGGATWEEANNGIAGLAVIDFEVIGSTLFVTSGGALYKSTDLGANWTPVNIGTSDYPLHLQRTSDGFYISVYTANGFKIYRSTNEGATWSLAGAFPLTGESIRELTAIGSELFAGLGNYGSVYRSVDAGATWQAAHENITGLDIKAIHVAGGKVFAGSLSDDGVHVSNDGGASWTPSGAGLPDPFKAATAFAQNSSYLFAAIDYWGTYRSTDDGATWLPANSGLNSQARRINALAIQGTDMFAATYDGVWRTTNNGNSWTIASMPGGFSHPQVLSIVSLGGTLFAGTERDLLFKSSDSGATWISANLGIESAGSIYSLVVRGTDLIAGTDAGVFLSSDNGASWAPRNGGLPAGAARTIAAQGTKLVTAIYDTTNLISKGVFISNDSGATWSSYGGGLDPVAVRTLVFNGNAVLAGTEAHSVLSTQIAAPLQMMSAVSRKTHSTAGTFDLNLPLSGTPAVESRSGAAGHTIVFTFSNDLTSGSAQVTEGVATISGAPVIAGKTVTVNLTNVSDRQAITVTVSDATDSFGQTLPPTSVRMTLLLGDTTGNNTVSSSDIAQLKTKIGQTVDETNFRCDVTVNGNINSSDLGVVKAASGGAEEPVSRER